MRVRKWRPRSAEEEEAADKAVNFITGLKHTKGKWAGVPFQLRPWQEHHIIRPLFGTLREDGKRQYRTALVEVPRKNGKSEIAAAIALKLLFRDGEAGAEIYGAASDRDQASIVFNVATQMVKQNRALSKACRIVETTKRIVRLDNGSFYRAIPADAAGSHGFNAHGVVFDELHVQRTRELWDVLTTSTGAREQPLVFAITTAGTDQQSICYEIHHYAEQVLAGLVEDPTFFAYIQAAPPDANWLSERVWKRCNPALGDFRNIEEMRDMARRAKHTPALQNTFRRLYMNVWTQQSERWIDMNLWDRNAGPTVNEANLVGRSCYGMLDLATTHDFTAWVMLFPHDNDPDKVTVVPRFFVPEARMKDTANRFRDQYRVWQRQRYLMVTPGESIDHEFVKRQVLDDAKRFRLVDMNMDRWQGHKLGTELAEEGIKVEFMGMGFASMAGPMTEFMRRLLAAKIHHGGNPVLRWMADNMAVKQDAAGNLKPDKATSQGKIDGMVGIVGALDRVMRNENRQVTWAAV